MNNFDEWSMNQPALKIGVILTLIFALSFSVMGARGNDCTCFESAPDPLRVKNTASTSIPTGCCEPSTPAPASNKPCPCQENACAFFQEKDRTELFVVQLNGFDFDLSLEPRTEQNFQPNHRDQNPSDLRIKTGYVLPVYVLRC